MSLIEFSSTTFFLMNKGVIVYNSNQIKTAVKNGNKKLSFSTDKLILPITENTYFHLRKRTTSLLTVDSTFMYFSLLNRIKDIRMSPPAIIDICEYAYNHCDSFMRLYNNLITMLSTNYTVIHDCTHTIPNTVNISGFKQKIPLDANFDDLYDLNIWKHIENTPNSKLLHKPRKPILIFLFHNEVLANFINIYFPDNAYPLTFLNRT